MRQLPFAYSEQAPANDVEFSRIRMPLRASAYRNFPSAGSCNCQVGLTLRASGFRGSSKYGRECCYVYWFNEVVVKPCGERVSAVPILTISRHRY